MAPVTSTTTSTSARLMRAIGSSVIWRLALAAPISAIIVCARSTVLLATPMSRMPGV